jgi:DUF971 family protein
MTPESPQSAPYRPVSLDLDLSEQVLELTWADRAVSRLPLSLLRKNCPCAGCRTDREKQGQTLLPILKMGPGGPIRATGGHLIGNYAIQIEWSDGHSSGIFDFRLLRSLQNP